MRIRRRCEECENGVVEHPLWQEYRQDATQAITEEAHRRAGDLDGEHGSYLRWWKGRGFYEMRGLDVLTLGAGFPAIPPEEVPCSECEGTTWVEEWRSLRALIAEGIADVALA